MNATKAGTKRTPPRAKPAEATPRATAEQKVILVGTYKGDQLKKWPGWYCWPLDAEEPRTKSAKSAKVGSDAHTAQPQDGTTPPGEPQGLRRVTELWLFQGTKAQRNYKAEFVGVKTRAELVRDYGYPATGKPHGSRYALFKTELLYRHKNAPQEEAEAVIVRTKDFARSPKVRRQLREYLQSPDRHDPDLAKLLPSIVTSIPPERLRVCEAAVQLDLFISLPINNGAPPSFSSDGNQHSRLQSSSVLATSFLPSPRTRLSKKEQFSVSDSGSQQSQALAACTGETESSSLGTHHLFHGDCRTVLRSDSFPEVDLAVADPPYWKVVGERWDYQWRTEEDYLAWSKQWLSAVYDKLRIGGSFFLFGYFRMLALLLPILKEIGFSLRQQILVDKGMKAVAGRATKNYRMFPCVTESILFLVKDNREFSRQLLLERQKALNLSSKEINERLGVKSNGGGMWSIYTGKNVCEQFPTRELWSKLQNILKFDFPYDKIVQTFNPLMGYSDVWTDIDFYKEKRWHPTQKPLPLIERLISVSSNKGDLVLDPFAGSGTTLIAAERLGRTAYAIELDSAYCDTVKRRFQEETAPTLDI